MPVRVVIAEDSPHLPSLLDAVASDPPDVSDVEQAIHAIREVAASGSVVDPRVVVEELAHEQVRQGLFGALVVSPSEQGGPPVDEVLALVHLYDGVRTVNAPRGSAFE